MIRSLRNFINSATRLYQHSFQPAPVLVTAGVTNYQVPQNFLAQDAIYNFSLKDPTHDKKKVKRNSPYIHSGHTELDKHLSERPLNNIEVFDEGDTNGGGQNHNPQKEREKRKKAAIPEITARMKDQLVDLGYSSEDTAVLTYNEAEVIISRKQRKLE